MIVAGSAIIAASSLFVIWRERQLAMARKQLAEADEVTTEKVAI